MDIESLDEEALHRALLSRSNLEDLDAYFGTELRRELSRLAELPPRDDPEVRASGLRKIWILPGIMGSKLSIRSGQGRRLIWLNLIALHRGEISELAIDQSPEHVQATGVMWSAYLRMKYRLRWLGFDVSFLPYDWRLSIDELGRRAAEKISAGPTPAGLVCHSMGGLVARRAVELLPDGDVPRIVTVGTPNLGSYSPVQVLRVVHSYVLLLGRLQKNAGPKEIVERYLRHFPGLLEMLPDPESRPNESYFEVPWWPGGGATPETEALAAARAAKASLQPPNDRFFQIIGYGEDTIVNARKTDDDLIFLSAKTGDGTVPDDLARHGNPFQTYYYEGAHGWLCNRVDVIHGAADIFRIGRTGRLKAEPDASRINDTLRELTLEDLQPVLPRSAEAALKVLREEDILKGFAELGSPDFPADDPLSAEPSDVHPLSPRTFSYIKSSAPRRRLNIDLLQGNILHVPAEAYVIGVFQGIPSLGGAAGAIDDMLGGALSEMVVDGQITGRLGEITFLPTPRYMLRTAHVIVVGLGPVGARERLIGAVELAGRNLARALSVSKISSFATVLWAAGTSLDGQSTFQALLDGIFDALGRWDEGQSFSRITVCELDPKRHAKLEMELSQIFARFSIENCEIVLNVDTVDVAAAVRIMVPGTVAAEGMPDSLTAVAELVEEGGTETLNLEISFARGTTRSVYIGAERATVTPSIVTFERRQLEELIAELESSRTSAQLRRLAERLQNLIFDEQMGTGLRLDPDGGLAVTNNPWASRIPWELLHADGKPLALHGGVSRRYLNVSGSVTRSRGARGSTRSDEELRLLLVADPTQDLPGAATEGRMVAELAQDTIRRLTLTPRGGLLGQNATHDSVTHWLASDDYGIDVLHYAGHAFFDPYDRGRSGLILHDRTLIGTDIASLPSLPRLVFLNACESGRVRRRDPNSVRAEDVSAYDLISRATGLAEAFMLGGVSQLIGTIWPVGDNAAKVFAREFYRVVDGAPIGDAVTTARRKLAETGVDWVNYMHYGEPSGRL